MERPEMLSATQAAEDTTILPAYMPIPGLGVLAANAFVVHARQPVLVDTGLPALAPEFIGELRSVIDPVELEWIWITHADADHLGALPDLLKLAPRARVVTTLLGMGKLLMRELVPPERVQLLAPGEKLDVGDRELFALRPPSYDAPETMGLFDARTRVLLSSDCFGAVLPAPIQDARDAPDAVIRQGTVTWTAIDAPWVSEVSAGRMQRRFDELRELGPRAVLSSHLAPARGMLEALLGHLGASCASDEPRRTEPRPVPDAGSRLA